MRYLGHTVCMFIDRYLILSLPKLVVVEQSEPVLPLRKLRHGMDYVLPNTKVSVLSVSQGSQFLACLHTKGQQTFL